MSPSIRPLYKGASVCGLALTVWTPTGHNAAIHRAVHDAAAGSVLVVSADAGSDYGYFGDLLAESCRQREVAGLVIDGTVRDADSLRQMRFPVFSTGVNPRATSKKEPGIVKESIRCGGAMVEPGDVVVGDADGVVVVPSGVLEAVAAAARAVEEREAAIRGQISKGLSTYEILKLSK